MKNTNGFNAALKEYLSPTILAHADDYGETEKAEKNPFRWALETAIRELPHVYAKKGRQAGLTEWLQGCALNVAIYNTDIVDVSEQLHGRTLAENQREKVVENWFPFLAAKIIQFSR